MIVPSQDAAQQYLYLADGTNHKVWILGRNDLEVVGESGRGGRQVGQFLRPHGMSIDAKGNLIHRRSVNRAPRADVHAPREVAAGVGLGLREDSNAQCPPARA